MGNLQGGRGAWGGRQKSAGVRGCGTSQPGDGASRAKMHLNWEPASWRAWGSRPLRVAGYSERWRLEPLCTGGKRPGMLASAWMWAAGVKPGHPGPHGPAGTSQTPASQTSAQPKGGDTDYLSEVPGVSRKEASGRRGPGTTRSEASAPGPRRGVETGGPRATGMAVQAPVDARSVSGSPWSSRPLARQFP